MASTPKWLGEMTAMMKIQTSTRVFLTRMSMGLTAIVMGLMASRIQAIRDLANQVVAKAAARTKVPMAQQRSCSYRSYGYAVDVSARL